MYVIPAVYVVRTLSVVRAEYVGRAFKVLRGILDTRVRYTVKRVIHVGRAIKVLRCKAMTLLVLD